jgi:RsiW-degrading membrane proteinase PrsW (M82 family)
LAARLAGQLPRWSTLNMNDPSMHTVWFARWHGITRGPYAWTELADQARDGVLHPDTEISLDQAAWRLWKELPTDAPEEAARLLRPAPPAAPPPPVPPSPGAGRRRPPAPIPPASRRSPQANWRSPADISTAAPGPVPQAEPMPFLPLRELLRPDAWRSQLVVGIMAFSVLPLLLSLFHLATGAGFERSAWLLGAYFCGLWVFVFAHWLQSDAKLLKQGILFALFTAFIGVPALLVWNHLLGVAQLGDLAAHPNPVWRALFFVLAVGVFEESCKAVPLLVFGWKTGAVRSVGAAVFLGILSGLGFAWNEGVGYSVRYWHGNSQDGVGGVLLHLREAGRTAGGGSEEVIMRHLEQSVVDLFQALGSTVFVQIVRLISLPLLHAAWSGLVAYSFVAAGRGGRWGRLLAGLGLAALLHGLYNTWSDELVGVQIAALSILLLLSCILYHRRTEGAAADATLHSGPTG